MNVSIQANGTEIEYGGCGAHDIEGYPDVAVPVAERPSLQQVIHQGKGHHQTRHEKVSDGQ